MREAILDELQKNQDIKYRDFQAKLIPSIDKENIIGVRIPVMRKLAKDIAKGKFGDYTSYLRELRNASIAAEQGNGHSNRYYEENMLHGFVIGYCKAEWNDFAKLLEGFVPTIDNWAVCDSTSATMKAISKNLPESRAFIEKYLWSEHEFEARFALMVLFDYFINDEYIDDILDVVCRIDREKYYVMMAVAWMLAECWLDYSDKVEKVFASKKLDAVTQNKAISKMRDSFRVSKEDKERVLQYRIFL